MAADGTNSLPTPPPEAVLLRLVRKAAGATVAEAARAAGISKAWLSSIENGHDTRGAEGVRPVRASDDIVARLAAYLHIDPDRLETEGERPDAAAVLREMQRGTGGRSSARQAPPPPAHVERPPDPDGYTRPAYDDPDVEAFARQLEHAPGMDALFQRDVAQAVAVMEQRKRLLIAEARVTELEAENAALRAEVARLRARPERQGALPAGVHA